MQRLAYAACAGALALLPLALLGQAQAADDQASASSSDQQQPSAAQQAAHPDITTRHEDDRTLQEYRVNGKLYAIKVTPKHGPSYYLFDHDGDGNFQRTDDTNRVVPPSWTLFKW